jgi:predicted NAD/FAD-binding protein
MKIAIIGAGWAGLAAAVRATQDGHHAIVFEASRAIGGRARSMDFAIPDGSVLRLDNGQHILIGAYTKTLELLETVGVDVGQDIKRLPLDLRYHDDTGLALCDLPSPLNAVLGIAVARGWSWKDRWSLLRLSTRWQRSGFRCAGGVTVADLCGRGKSIGPTTEEISPKVYESLIEPLCVAALNTPPDRACGQIFLHVLRDSLFGGRGSSDLLLPMADLSGLFPTASAQWLRERGCQVLTGARVIRIELVPECRTPHKPEIPYRRWRIHTDQGPDDHDPDHKAGTIESSIEEEFDAVILATSASHAAKVAHLSAKSAPERVAIQLKGWASRAEALQHEAIATIYAHAEHARLPRPMVALKSHADFPAQFVIDRGQLGGPPGLLAFVVSASTGDRESLQRQVLHQAHVQLGLWLRPVQTIVEKRATFACTPSLLRPPSTVAPFLWACGDYIDGPYPATLEGAIRSGLQAAAMLAR